MVNEVEMLQDVYEKSMELAAQWGLRPYQIDFHVVPAHKIYEMASYGVPGHYNHWSFGRDYWIEKTYYDWGISKIYELIIPTNPSQAFLLENNSLIENSLVIAHCVGHSDVFANNVYFEKVNTNFDVTAAAVADMIRAYEHKYGFYEVESFIDKAMSLTNLTDSTPFVKDHDYDFRPTIFHETEYDDLFDDVQEVYEEQREISMSEIDKGDLRFAGPTRDIMGYIAEFGKLKEWQRNILLAVREERNHYVSMMKTKILNEGWAAFIHHKIMHELDLECDPGGIQFSKLHSSILGSYDYRIVNPYALGFKIFKSIEENGGWDELLEARAINSDYSLVANYLTEEIVHEMNMFVYARKKVDDPIVEEGVVLESKQWEDVRTALLNKLSNFGWPVISIVSGDNKLVLKHHHEGVDLNMKWAHETLKIINQLWGRPVELITMENGVEKTLVASEVK